MEDLDDETMEKWVYAAEEGETEELEEMLENHDDIMEITNEDGLTALHIAVRYEHDDTAQMLLDKGANVNAINSDGTTPLHIVFDQGATYESDIVQMLLEKNAGVNTASEPSFRTPLHEAINTACTEAVELLLTNNANVNAVDSDGYTALHHAAGGSSDTNVQALLRSHADVLACETSVCRLALCLPQDTPESIQCLRSLMLVARCWELSAVLLHRFLL
eukprot:m.472319 g.472319  ORF g.472319 m.472319 type:complete len:219 (-) comp21660_c1_seq4:827-1483(-)